MGTSAGYVGTGAKFYSLDESAVLAGLLGDTSDAVVPDNKPSDHDKARIDYLEDAA